MNVHAGHDDYHCIDDTGFIQVMAKSAQEAADLNLIARKTAELSLTPATVGQDGFLTTHLIDSCRLPERELVAEYLGRPDDIIDTPTPAQAMMYGPKRRRIPAIWDVDMPITTGPVQNQDSLTCSPSPGSARISSITSKRSPTSAWPSTRNSPAVRIAVFLCYRVEDADYVIVGMGGMIVQAEAVADYLRETRKIKVGIVNLTMYRPFPGDLIGQVLRGKKGCRGARAHRPAAFRRPAADARNSLPR